jgi:hypothetical protein
MAATRIRVTLRYVEILDRKDLDEYGEFVFRFKVSVPERDLERSVRLPESGHYSVSDHPSMNRLKLDKVIFEGEVWDGDSMVIEATGEELDTLTPNDHLESYRRVFTGPVAGWMGRVGPWDEGSDEARDAEQLEDWRIAFDIEDVSETDVGERRGAPGAALARQRDRRWWGQGGHGHAGVTPELVTRVGRLTRGPRPQEQGEQGHHEDHHPEPEPSWLTLTFRFRHGVLLCRAAARGRPSCAGRSGCKGGSRRERVARERERLACYQLTARLSPTEKDQSSGLTSAGGVLSRW